MYSSHQKWGKMNGFPVNKRIAVIQNNIYFTHNLQFIWSEQRSVAQRTDRLLRYKTEMIHSKAVFPKCVCLCDIGTTGKNLYRCISLCCSFGKTE